MVVRSGRVKRFCFPFPVFRSASGRIVYLFFCVSESGSGSAWVCVEAEAEKQAAILKAEAEKENILRVHEGQAESIRMINEANPGEAYILLKKLETLAQVGDGQATKIVIPSELQGLVGLVNTIKEAK